MKRQYGRNQWKVTLLNLGVILLIILVLAAAVFFAYPHVKPVWDEFRAEREAAKLEEEARGEGEPGEESGGDEFSAAMAQSGNDQADGETGGEEVPGEGSPEENPGESVYGEEGSGEDLGEGDQGEPEEEKIHRYEFVPSDGNWEEAMAAALEAGGYLVTITSPEEEYEIEQLMEQQEGYIVVWLGASKLSGDFAWENGEAWVYDNWAEGEPNNETGSEDFLLMYRVKQVWCWNDVDVDVSTYYKGRMGYIIEYEE